MMTRAQLGKLRVGDKIATTDTEGDKMFGVVEKRNDFQVHVRFPNGSLSIVDATRDHGHLFVVEASSR